MSWKAIQIHDENVDQTIQEYTGREINNVYFNDTHTTVTWGEDSCTTVNWLKDGCLPYSRLIGFAMCVLKAVMERPECGLTYMEAIKRRYPSVLFNPEYVQAEIDRMFKNGDITENNQKWLVKHMKDIEAAYCIYASSGFSVENAMQKAILYCLVVRKSPKKKIT